jgi:FkbM family methyltransferase
MRENRAKRILKNVLSDFQKHYKQILSLPKERKYNIISVKPAYKIVNILTKQSIVVDLGTGKDADFSQDLIDRYGLRAFGFDPTRKHHPALDSISKERKGSFSFHKYAISDTCGTKLFYESLENVSGSFLRSHVNVRKDKVRAYEVETVNLEAVFDMLNIDYIDLLKMDIEGEEYSVLSSAPLSVLGQIDQIVVEFHHGTINQFDVGHTRRIVRILETAGFMPHTVDCENYLFFRPNPKRAVVLKGDADCRVRFSALK